MKDFKSELARIGNATQRSRPKLKPRKQRRAEAQNLAQKKNG
jgi:hypothetical protein